MENNGGRAGDSRMRLLVAKGSFAPMGGAERDIIRNLPSLSKTFSVSVATLESMRAGECLQGNMAFQLMLPYLLEWSKSSMWNKSSRFRLFQGNGMLEVNH